MSLKKELGFWDIFSIAAGAMISSGLFVLPGIAYTLAGTGVIFAYILASIIMIPTISSEVELSTAMPKAGGDYFFIDRSLGVAGGTVGGLANWIFISMKTSFALVGIGAFLQLIYPNISEFQMRLLAAGIALIFVIINLLSVKFSGKIEFVLVFWLIVILVVYIYKGISVTQLSKFSGNMKGIKSIVYTAGVVFISYGGITKITSVAEEVKNPTKNLPRGIYSAFIVVSVLYFLAIFATIGVMEHKDLMNSYAPLSEASVISMGNIGYIFLSIGAIMAFITTGNAGIMAASRYLIAMSRDEILPKTFSRVSKKYHTPYVSIISTGIFIITVILVLDIKSLVKAASTLMLVSFIFVNISVIVMRESNLSSYRPKVKSYFYPFLQIIGIFLYFLLILGMGAEAISISMGFIFLAVCWYFLYVKDRVSRESALMHIVRKLTSKELIDSNLDNELKDILLERDNIIEDRFDQIINESIVLDIHAKKVLELEEFLELASKSLEKRFELEKEKIFSLLMQREKESSTILKEGLAIPHIVIEGTGKFDILVARSENGINFKFEDKIVDTVFVLGGSKDERNFHLKALMYIAQIVSDESFEEKWKKAKNIPELKNILLLAKRKRESN
jgi:amino acid transporter/mannitol/fructose-specific phosphotransferase system IIA component